MPIRSEPSFDPNLVGFPTGYLNDCLDVETSGAYDGALLVYNAGVTGWIIGSGSQATGSLNSLSDVNVGNVQSGQVLEYLGPVYGWTGVNITGGSTGTIPAALDDLTDVSTTGNLQINMWLGYNGANWRQSFFDTTNLSNVSGHSLADQDHSLVYQPTVGKYISTHVIAAPTGLRTTNSAEQMSGNTDILQTLLNRHSGLVYIPSGVYRIKPLYVRGNNTHLFGQGTLLVQTGYTDNAIITVSGSNCTIEGITLDGNKFQYTGAIGRGEGIRTIGNYNTIRDVKIINLPSGGSANAFMIFSDNNLITRCYSSGAGFAGFYNNGDNNLFRDNIAVDFNGKGFTSNGGPYNKLSIDGFYGHINNTGNISGIAEASGPTPLQIDPGPNTTDYIRCVSVNNAFCGDSRLGGAAAKFAKIDELHITNSTFKHRQVDVSSIKVAEGVNNLTIENCHIVRDLNFDNTVGNFTIKNTRFGEDWSAPIATGTVVHNPNSQIFDLNCTGHVIIENCKFEGFGTHAIDLDNPSIDSDTLGGYKSIRIENCHFAGSGGGTLRDINMTAAGAIDWSRRLRYRKNTRSVYGGGTAIITTSTWLPYFANLNESATEFSGTGPPTSTSTNWHVGDIIRSVSSISSGSNIGWVCITSGAPGTWAAYGNIGNTIGQSYLTGVNDIILSGIPSTGADVTTQFKNFFNNIQENTTVRISPGIYRISDTITAYGKRNVFIDARGAQFYEINRLPSGTFWFDRCTGISWEGGLISGADTLAYLLATASGVERSGIGFEDLAPAGDTTESTRKVIGQAFNFNFCKNMYIKNVNVHSKYQVFYDYFGDNIRLDFIYHSGVQTGTAINSSDERPLLGTGTVTFGQYYKEGSRNSYSYSFSKTSRALVTNCISEQVGGMFSAGTPSLGGGGSAKTNNITISHCQAHNVYDNGAYLSSIYQADIEHFRVVNDTGIPHASIVGMKGRGPFIRFNNCYVEHVHGGYGIEGFGSTADYWTNFGSEGWTSQGCAITNCVGVDCVANGAYLDRNNTIYPRDVLIQGNYFYECGAGPSGRVPTGYISTEVGDDHAVILCNDGMRVKIIDNTIENSGVLAADYGIYVGRKFLGSSVYITGCEISDNKLLGQKIGIYMKNLTFATVRNNYGERIGVNNFNHITESGVPTLIQTFNVKNSRFTDNMVAPTGHAFVVRSKPTGLWENNILRDNIGQEQIN